MYTDFKPDGKCYYCGEEYKQYMKPIFDNDYAIAYMAGYQKYYPGRCIVVLKNHKVEMNEMTPEEISGFFEVVSRVAGAIQKAFPCDKLNYGVCGDGNRHFHMHIVPKIKGGYTWGQLFEMLPPLEDRILIPIEELDKMIEKIRENL